jgi:oligo-1,6-glucosidase/alpha-glucosidase
MRIDSFSNAKTYIKLMSPLQCDQIPWWKKTTVYQIYPRSYQDSNEDGIGDLRGIISRLDYIKSLGVETIWFSPFFTSPQADFGYDIADYRNIAEEYGDLKTVEDLIKGIHDRGMKVVFDMVMNHTSDQHPWFLESRSSRDNPKRDWYIWRDGRKPGGKAPPNNWRAMITGSGWHYDAKTDQWYWSQFLPFQPDLNYRNPEVKQMMFDTVRFWLKKGVDGFRLDIINTIYEDPQFRDNPFKFKLIPSDADPDALFRSSKYTVNHPDTFEFVKELRAVIDEFSNPPRYLVGEVSGPIHLLRQFCGKEKNDGLNTVFLFKALGAPLKAPYFRKLIHEFEHHFPDPFIPTWVFGNHDRARRISRLGDDPQKAKLNTALQLTVRGVPYIYYGEEIGMRQLHFPVKTSQDAVALGFAKFPQWIFNLVWKFAKESINRDECRTPMQWTPDANAGFCPNNVTPWLPVDPLCPTINVTVEDADPDSLYHCYRRFLKVRKEYPALNAGDIQVLDDHEEPKTVLMYSRTAILPNGDPQILYVVLNFATKPVSVTPPIENATVITSTTIHSKAVNGGKLDLGPLEGIILK